MFGNTNEKRFEQLRKETPFPTVGTVHYDQILIIIRDTQTGVQYLMTDKGGITPLLDKDGKPIMDDSHQ